MDRSRGIKGSGVIARIRFQALAAGISPLRLDRALAWDSVANRMSVTVLGTSVRVR
jgi:hypothetical protein